VAAGTARAPVRPEAGFTLVMLMVILAVMAIAMGAAVQTVSFQARREKEAELVFRGEQYVEAIRLFKNRYGRFPVTLKEMWEAKPRVLRKPWKDPITGSDQWGIIHLGEEGQPLVPGPGGTPGSGFRPTPTPTPMPTPPPGVTGGLPGIQPGQQVGPIIGVRSTSCEDSIRVYEGRTRYCDWKFVFRENQGNQGSAGPPNQPPGQPTPPLEVR
jgi:type II secretory pathway pseudopilin PulG